MGNSDIKNSVWKNIRSCIPTAILAIYIWCVFVLQAISVDLPVSVSFALYLGGASIVVSWLSIKLLGKLILNLILEDNKADARKWGIVAFVLFLAMSFLGLLAFYPGGITDDTINQFEQAMALRPYSNWHPALHTFIFFSLPLKAGPYISLIVLYQLVLYSAVVAYLVYVLINNGMTKCCVIFFAVYILVNPFMITYLMFPWKDIAFMILSMWAFACYVQIFGSGGDWLRKKPNMILFSAVLCVCYYMRHNASLFVIPLLIIVLFYILKDKKVRIMLIGLFAVMIISVELLYTAVGVERPAGRTVEVVGLPINVWCNVMQKNPDVIPDDVSEVLLSLASQEAYQNLYKTGDFNGFKSSGDMDINKINSFSLMDVAYYTIECFRYAPAESWEAVAKLTDLVWDIDGKCMPCIPIVIENDYGFEPQYNEGAYNLMMTIILFGTDGLGKIFFGSFGLMMLICLAVGLSLLSRGRKSFIHALPLLCYNFGTMLLLSGEDYRLFLISIPLTIPTLFLMVKDTKKWKTVD